jgi:hypothetical protein
MEQLLVPARDAPEVRIDTKWGVYWQSDWRQIQALAQSDSNLDPDPDPGEIGTDDGDWDAEP